MDRIEHGVLSRKMIENHSPIVSIDILHVIEIKYRQAIIHEPASAHRLDLTSDM